MSRLASEGYPFIAVSGIAATGVFFFGGTALSVPFFVLALFMLFFFRDPGRAVPSGSDLFVSPADGKVILIQEVFENRCLETDTKQISIFMSPLDVHVNRSPCAGSVKSIRHSKGRFLAAYRDDSSMRNENIEMVLETEYGAILVRQVAGFLARRAVCRKKEGDKLKRGERYGIIKFSSRLDVYLPKNALIKVKLKDRVKAGETVIAEMPRLQRDMESV